MYVLYVNVVVGQDQEWAMEMIANFFHSKLYQFEKTSCHGATFMFDDKTGTYGTITYWETEDAALAACQKYLPILREMLEDNFQWEPSVQVFRVYEPRLIMLDN